MAAGLETLSEETWDVVISGTSLSQSLLALALSKSGLKVLHVDQNDYYGGVDAGLSLDEAQRWIQSQKDTDGNSEFSVEKADDPAGNIGPSRSYTIGLAPQIVYAKSRFLPTLVSSQVHTQLEFQAIGPFWVYADGKLQKIPSNREDVFADDSLSVRDKRRLMSLLRYVTEEKDETSADSESVSLEEKLQGQFKIPEILWPPVQALTLSTNTLANTNFGDAMPRLKRHLISMGYFGPGLAAVMAKYGGNSEIAQVACRAGAVGGFVYLLGHGVASVNIPDAADSQVEVELSDGTKVKAKHLVGMQRDLPANLLSSSGDLLQHQKLNVAHRTSIVSKPLRHIFVAASESSPVPAVGIVLMGEHLPGRPPVYLQVHSEDTGECPSGQCIVYASVIDDGQSNAQELLKSAIDNLLRTSEETEPVEVLWSMSFTQHAPAAGSLFASTRSITTHSSGKLLVFPPRSHDIAFDDGVLDHVKSAWEAILGERSAEYDFLRFEERKDTNEDD